MSEKLTREQQLKLDMEELLKLAPFMRFIFELIQRSGYLDATTDGSVERILVSSGRRQLAREILDMVEIGQPAAHPGNMPILTLMQTLREEAQQHTESRNEKSSRYDRTAELADPDEDDAD